jgi:hypothetical protein
MKERAGTEIIVEARWRNEQEFVTIGPFHLKLWILMQASLVSKMISIPLIVSNIYVSCAIFADEMLLGDADGIVQVWKYQNGTFSYLHSSQNHDNSPVEAIFINKDL